MADSAPGTAQVTDHRTAPRGVLPRGAQTWLMVALALGILGIIVFTGQPTPAARPAAANAQALAPNPDRLRDYQDRLRALDERARQQALNPPRQATLGPVYDDPPPSAGPDPLETDRRRREYESLFASNVVLSRRPDAQRPTAGSDAPARGLPSTTPGGGATPAPPTLDEVAEAVMRATARYAPSSMPQIASPSPAASSSVTATAPSLPAAGGRPRPTATGPISSSDPLQRILEGTVIDTVLANRLDGSVAAPVNCLVTNPIYSHDGQHVLIPAGARVLGETKPVQSVGERRLAVAFHRLLLPDGRAYSLDQFIGLNQIGDAGLRDQVNQHYWSTFGAAAAVGVISGLGQYLGTLGLGQGTGDRTVVITGGLGNTTAQATSQVMSHFLNRLPTVTIREGHRVAIYLTSDLELPAYESRKTVTGSPLARVP